MQRFSLSALQHKSVISRFKDRLNAVQINLSAMESIIKLTHAQTIEVFAPIGLA